MDEMARDWHRRFAMEAFGACWDLIDRPERSADEDLDVVLLAAASRWHWSAIGGGEQLTTGDWQVARAAALVGLPDLALRFAQRNLDQATSMGWTGWRLASAHEGMARARAAAGDAPGRQVHLDEGWSALASEGSTDDRAVVAAQLESVPEAVVGN